MITDLAYPLIVFGGLFLAVRLRRRLGPAAGAAIAGFIVLASSYALGWLVSEGVERWTRAHSADYDGDPFPGLPAWFVATALVLGIVHAAGIGLLVVAALRGRGETVRQHP